MRFVGIVMMIAACSRTGVRVEPAPPQTDIDLDAEVLVEDVPSADRPARRDAPATPTVCAPAPEVCNRVDDDCNGRVDDVRPEPCPRGGMRFCVAGAMSACPRACPACQPGAERVCYVSFCNYWGTQTCAADGRGFGPCIESAAGEIPPECLEVARASMDSRALEECCIDAGACCHDRFDVDGDGDRAESVGTCEDVACE